LQNKFRTRLQQRKLGNTKLKISLYEKRRFNMFVNVLFTMIIVGLIMGPVMVLYSLRNANGFLLNATAIIFTASFALLCSTATNAKRQEIFAVTAA
jgi:hypothetical protein